MKKKLFILINMIMIFMFTLTEPFMCFANSTSATEESNMNEVPLKGHFVIDVTADNITNIGGFDLIIKYDSDKLKLTGYGEVSGIKFIVKRLGPGEIRVTLFGLTSENFVNGKQSLLKIGFDGMEPGDALIDITRR